jgi:hypothetical protein
MKIALYNSFNGHFEVIGYIMELFSKDNNSITLYHNNGDRFGYIDYFEELFGKINKISIDDFKNSYKNYDIIFFITMTIDIPSYISDIKDKTYGILHVSSRRSKYINNYISLYPYKKNKTVQKLLKTNNFNYTFPFYNAPSAKNFSDRKYILQIGVLWDNDDDLKNFQKNINYEIIYFSRKSKSFSSQLDCRSRDMFLMSKYLQNSLFILGRKTWHYPYAYTGSLTLSFSFNVPIILPEFKQKEYNVPCVTFKENYSELIDYINNINVDDYNNLLKKMNDVKEKEIQHNRENFNL